jgi:hypothetical protein
VETLSPAAARRIALEAQGLARPRPDRPVDRRRLLKLVDRLALHQIDSVNVLARAHYLPAFSRLGVYPREALDALAWGSKPRRLFEYWAHEASLLPLDLHPLLRWRMARAERGESGWKSLRPFRDERRAEADAAFARIAAEGPLAASDFEERSKGGWWGWSSAKAACEWLFLTGRITTATRRNSFERVYDLTERVIPAAALSLPTPTEADAHRALLERSARAHGIGTARDLRDYFRLAPADAAPRLAELVEEGTLLPVQVKGWRDTAYLHRDSKLPRRAEGRALLVPFDPLVWERARAERLFGFRYRIEIYTPAEKRVHGYYVLPFLLRDRLVARVDLKSDRQSGALLVQGAFAEPDAPEDTAAELAAELRMMADWLGLERVEVRERGDLAPALRSLSASA